MSKKFYITTTLPYVNAEPHLGFALEIVQADVVARYHKELLGENVIFNTGTDEHGQKIYEKAIQEKKDPQTYCDEYAAKFNNLKKALNLSYTNFIRTTDKHHMKAAQDFWRLCAQNGFIKKGIYKMKYCIGCELEKTDSELVDNKCPLHPNLVIKILEEENYFFTFSKFAERLESFYDTHPDFVEPLSKYHELRSFVAQGLKDFSISRLKKKMPWGIEVPDDPDHIIYVWFDALINYISTLGWPEDGKNFTEYWSNSIQVAGKDNLRQQSAMWQAMLMAAGLPNSTRIFIHGFISSDGQKMSKSLGNVIDPFTLVNKYGTDAIRYYLLKEIPSLDDGNYSEERMKEIYNADLANELGNLVSRLTNLAKKESITVSETDKELGLKHPEFVSLIEHFKFNYALEYIWVLVKNLNKQLDEFAPWKNELGRAAFLEKELNGLYEVGQLLRPLLPETAKRICESTTGKIEKVTPLFPRLVS